MSPSVSVQVADVGVQVPLPPGALAETGAHIFRTTVRADGGTGGWSGRGSGWAGDDAAAAAKAEAAGADNATTPVHIGDMADHGPSAGAAETHGGASSRSRQGAASPSKQNSVAVDGCAAANVARVHNLAPLAEVRERDNRVSPPPRKATVVGAGKYIQPGTDTRALLGRELGMPCDGVAAAISGAYNTKAAATANASERLRS